jgi:hypothetical protein
MSDEAANASSQEGLAPVWVGLAILVFFPLGLFLLWRHPTLRHNKTWWAVGTGWAILYLVANANRPSSTSETAESGDDSRVVVEASSSPEPPVKRSFWGATQLAYGKRIDLCDNPDKYKNTEMKMEVKYRGGGLRQGGKLTNIRCTVFYGDGSFEMAFMIPNDVSQPRIEPGQYLWVTFVFSGSVDSPSRVTAISRK